MRFSMTLIGALGVLLFATAAAGAEPAPGSADATILLNEVELTVHDDGRVERRIHTVTRLHTLYAVNRLGDPRIEYDLAHQELSLLAARTITADGRTLDAPAYAMNRSTPDAVAMCPDFAGIGELVVTFMGLEKEAVTELQYVVRDKVPWQAHGEVRFYFGDRFPVEESRLKVRVPARSNLHKSVLAAGATINEAAPVHEQATATYEWTAAKLPGYTDHGWDKPLRVPLIVVSTAPHWADLLEPLVAWTVSLSGYPHWEKLLPHLLPPDKPATSDAALLALLVKGIKNSLRIVQLGPGALPLSPRLLPRVAESRCATPLESALLLASAMHDAGLHPTVLLATTALPPGDAAPPPAGGVVSDAYVAVRVDGVPVFVDAATFKLAGGIRNGHLRWLAGFSPGARHFVTPGAKYLRNAELTVSVQAQAVLGPEGLKLSGSLDTAGDASLWFDFPSGLDAKAGTGLIKGAFGPDLIVDKVVVSTAFPGRFSAQFEAHLAPGGQARHSITLKGAPLADRVERTLMDWLRRAADGPSFTGPMEYVSTLSFEGAGAEFVGGLADAQLEVDGASYRVASVQDAGKTTATRRFRLSGETASPNGQALAVAARFAADNRRDNILLVIPNGE